MDAGDGKGREFRCVTTPRWQPFTIKYEEWKQSTLEQECVVSWSNLPAAVVLVEKLVHPSSVENRSAIAIPTANKLYSAKPVL